ncbi:MAG TPA: hypothetical protein VGJ37_11400 [Pyrinomonadaceae bacterium]|jgi:hypothetical protein
MPKDPTRNIERYKVRGGHLNEYEYHKNQQQAATDKAQIFADKKPKKSASKKAEKQK